MPVPPHVIRFWQALDRHVGDVEPAWWGAVVTAPAFPAVWDANYARIDTADPDVNLNEIADALRPALERVGTDVFHVVSFHPDETTAVLSDLSSRGHRLAWDLVMDRPPMSAGGTSRAVVEELVPDRSLWDRVEESMALFGIEPAVAAQLRDLEVAIHARAGKRWFGVRDERGNVVSLAALVVLEGVGYLDNVVTFPGARGRGFASAVAARALHEAEAMGADRAFLLAEPDAAPVIRLYERLGFRAAGMIASTRGSRSSVGPR